MSNKLVNTAASAFSDIANKFSIVIKAMENGLSKIGPMITSSLTTATSKIITAFGPITSIFNAIAAALPGGALTLLSVAFSTITMVLLGPLLPAVVAVIAAMMTFADIVSDALEPVMFDISMAIVSVVIPGLIMFVEGIFQVIDFILSTIPLIIDWGIQIYETLSGMVTTYIKPALAWLQENWQVVLTAIMVVVGLFIAKLVVLKLIALKAAIAAAIAAAPFVLIVAVLMAAAAAMTYFINKIERIGKFLRSILGLKEGDTKDDGRAKQIQKEAEVAKSEAASVDPNSSLNQFKDGAEEFGGKLTEFKGKLGGKIQGGEVGKKFGENFKSVTGQLQANFAKEQGAGGGFTGITDAWKKAQEGTLKTDFEAKQLKVQSGILNNTSKIAEKIDKDGGLKA
jgi:hypothetical protein